MVTLQIASTWDGVPVGEDEAVEVALQRDGGRLEVRVDAPWHRDPPPRSPPGPTDGLWEHEVVEVFLAGPSDADGRVPYTEIEIGPHGHHLVLRLRGVRDVEARLLPLELHIERSGSRWRARAWLSAEHLPAGPLQANAYAIHGVGAARRYLAWRPVPGAAPDFHQPARFAPITLG